MTIAEHGNALQSVAKPDTHVGGVIRRLRSEKNMSLQELSRLSGVSSGMLSQIERDLANPSLKVLTKIQQALGTTAGALFPQGSDINVTQRDPEFVRRKDQRPLCELGYLTKELLSTGSSQSLELMLLHIPPNGSSGGTPLTSPAEKGGLVLDGEIFLTVDGKEAKLREGDSFIFDGRLPHAFRNLSSLPVKVFWVISNFPIERHL